MMTSSQGETATRRARMAPISEQEARRRLTFNDALKMQRAAPGDAIVIRPAEKKAA
jgi:hypothetical protein